MPHYYLPGYPTTEPLNIRIEQYFNSSTGEYCIVIHTLFLEYGYMAQ